MPVFARTTLTILVIIACTIAQALIAWRAFDNKKKVPLVCVLGFITSIIAAVLPSKTKIVYAPSSFVSETELFAYNTTEPWANGQLSAFFRLLILITVVELIITVIQCAIYKKTNCCKHPYLFSLSTNLITFGGVFLYKFFCENSFPIQFQTTGIVLAAIALLIGAKIAFDLIRNQRSDTTVSPPQAIN